MLSVTCPKCSARYTMSEELYQRKGGGQAVIVTCRRCKSEVRFEASDEKTKPSNEIPMVAINESMPSKEPDAATDDAGPFVALSSGFFGSTSEAPVALTPSMVARPLESGAGTADAPASKPKEPDASPISSRIIDVPAPPAAIFAAAAKAEAVSADSPKSEPAKAESASAESPKSEPAKAESASAESPKAEPAKAEPTKKAEPPESPPASMPVDSSELLGDDQVMSVRGGDMIDQSETVPLVMNKSSNGASALAPPPPKGKKAPPSPPKKQKEPEPDDDQPPPSSSGVPTLTKLMGTTTTTGRPKKNRAEDEFLLGLNAPTIPLAPPTIDVSTLGAPPESEPPASERSPDSIPVSSRHPHKKKKKKKHGTTSLAPTKSSAPKTSVPAAKPSKSVSVPAPAPEAEKKSVLPWILVAVAAAAAVGFYMKSQNAAPAEPKPTATVEQVAPPPTVATTAAPAATAEPTATASTAAAAPTASAGKPSGTPTVNKPAEAKPGEAAPAEAKPAEAKPAEAAAAPAEAPAEAAATNNGPFQPEAAKAALAAAAAQAAGCRKGEDPSGTAAVVITFAPSGRVTSATISGPPFAGTATGGCIAAAMRKAKVPPFDGDRITVSKTISVQ